MNIGDLIQALSRPDDALADDLSPLAATWADPEAYRRALAEHVAGWGAGKLRSQSGRAVDPYADAVGRHLRSSAPALVWYDADRGWMSMAYARLDQLASGLAARWIARGVEAGAVVAIIHGPGPERLVAMMAALRVGAVMALLEPEGAARLPARLEALAPDFLVYDLRRPPPVGECDAPVLGADGGEQDARSIRGRGQRALPPPPPYAADAPLALSFSPVRPAESHPTPVPAADAIFGALGDGVVGLRLTPGRRFAAPGVHPLQYAPCLELSVLLCGATLVHIPWPDLARRPQLLTAQRIDVLFIGEALRDLLSTQPVQLQCTHWLRGLDAPLDWPCWRALIDATGLDKARSSNVLIDAASGGALLHSVDRPGSISARAVPAPGRPWMSLDVNAPEREAADSAGLFQVLAPPTADGPPAKPEPDEGNPAWFVLGRQGAEYLYGGPLGLRRSARIYPTAEVEAAVQPLPGVEAVCAVTTVANGEGWFTTLVFTGAPDGRATPSRADVRAAIAQAVGPDGRPDAVEILPLYPRRAEGEVDRGWCTQQYQSGRLVARAEDDAFVALTALRAELLGE